MNHFISNIPFLIVLVGIWHGGYCPAGICQGGICPDTRIIINKIIKIVYYIKLTLSVCLFIHRDDKLLSVAF